MSWLVQSQLLLLVVDAFLSLHPPEEKEEDGVLELPIDRYPRPCRGSVDTLIFHPSIRPPSSVKVPRPFVTSKRRR